MGISEKLKLRFSQKIEGKKRIKEMKQEVNSEKFDRITALVKKNKNQLKESERLSNQIYMIKKNEMHNNINQVNNNKEILKNGELMAVIFFSLDQNIIFPIICKRTDNFKKIESSLYEKYPDLIDI